MSEDKENPTASGFAEVAQKPFETSMSNGPEGVEIKNDLVRENALFNLAIRQMQFVWSNKIGLSLFFLLGIAVTAFALFKYQPTSSATVVVRPISSDAVSGYSALNFDREIVRLFGTEKDQDGASSEFVNSADLINKFVFEFRTSPALRNAVEEYYASELNDKSNFEKLVHSYLDDFSITDPSKREPDYLLKYKTRDNPKSQLVLENALTATNVRVREKLLETVENIIVGINSNLEASKASLRERMVLEREKYKLDLQNRLIFLKEQASIAREIGVEKNQLETIVPIQSEKVSIADGTELQFYLRGFAAIEKEISLLEGRTASNVDQYIDTIPALKASLNSLENDQRIERIRNAVKLSPLATDNFNAVVYDVKRANVSAGLPAWLISLVIILGFLAVGFIYLHIRRYWKQNKQKFA